MMASASFASPPFRSPRFSPSLAQLRSHKPLTHHTFFRSSSIASTCQLHSLTTASLYFGRAISPLNKKLFSVSPDVKSHLENLGKEDALHSTKWVEEILVSLQLGHGYDLLCAIAVMTGAFVWIQLLDFLVKQNFVERKLSRKLIHISTGILFVLAWPVFSKSPVSRFCAVLVPFANFARLLIYGLGILKDEGLVNSISREGTPSELLRGPLYYVLVLCCCTVFFWRDSPVGMTALAMMCGGDGVADIIGRKFGGSKLPYNHGKSWAGSSAMFLFGFFISLGFMFYYYSLGFFNLDWKRTISSLAFISLAATVVESLPIASKIDDNLSVPLTAIVLGQVLFPGATL